MPPSREDALLIVQSEKERFEIFHRVQYSTEAAETALVAAIRFLPDLSPVAGALDLLDEAGTRVKLRREAVPPDVAQIKSALRRVTRQKQHDIDVQNYELARRFSEQEEALREKLKVLEDEHLPNEISNAVTAEHLIQLLADRTHLSTEAVRNALQHPPALDLVHDMRDRLTAGIPLGRRDWIEGLLAYLSHCSKQDADRLAHAIQTVKTTLDQQSR